MQNAAKENAQFFFFSPAAFHKTCNQQKPPRCAVCCAASRDSWLPRCPGASEGGRGLPPTLILLWARSSCSPAARGFGVRCCRLSCLAEGDCRAAARAGCLVVAVVSLQFPYFPSGGSQGWRLARPAPSRCAGAGLVFVRSLTAKRKPAPTSPSWHGCCGEDGDGLSCSHPHPHGESRPSRCSAPVPGAFFPKKS